MRRPVTARSRRAAVCATVALLAVACAPDGPDAYTAPETDAPPATRAPASESDAGGDESGMSAADPDEGADEEQTAEAGASAGASAAEGSGAAETYPPNGETVEVLALDNTFRAETIEIAAGTEVVWENRGRNDHNVLPVDETEEWGVEVDDFAPGDEYAHLFDTPGEYPYYCSLHGTADFGMIGTVVVTG